MQNRSYDRYVELLRAAELQTYERTSARFVASVGSVGAMSWLTRSQWLGWMSSIVVVAVSAFIFLTTRSKDIVPVEHAAHTFTHQATTAQSSSAYDARNRKAADHQANVILSTQTDLTAQIAFDNTTVGNEQLTAAAHDEDGTEREATIAFTSIAPDVMAESIAASPSPIGQLMDEIAFESSTACHEWSISLEGDHVALSQPLTDLDARFGIAIDISNGFSLGLGIGVRSFEEHTTTFAGYTDTVFVIGNEELPSKIGRYVVRDRSVTNLVAGISAQYRFDDLTGSEKLFPFISVFNGIEGKSLILEQSAGIEWKVSGRLSATGGVSLREYPLADRTADLLPRLGLRFVL